MLRTVAIAMMVIYHVAYNVDMLGPEGIVDPHNGWWRALQVACGSTFLAIVGIAYAISDQRLRATGLRGLGLWRRHARRSVQVLAAAALITVATLVALGNEFVRFGILHVIAVTTLVVLPLLTPLRSWCLPAGVALVLGGLLIAESSTSVSVLMVLGLDPGETGVDWYPLLPWSGASLIGYAIGLRLYPGGRRGPLVGRLPGPSRTAIAAGAPGRHSLPFYIVHQPVLIALTAGALALEGTAISLDGD